jgi:hypothetical protein
MTGRDGTLSFNELINAVLSMPGKIVHAQIDTETEKFEITEIDGTPMEEQS